MNKIHILLIFVLCLSSISAVQVCSIYDDFSSGVLDETKWEIRQDVEGQPFMEEYWVDNESLNFHTAQNTIGDHRVYLFPIYNFTTGDVFEYDVNLISKENNYMQMVLLTGDQYIRVGIFGYVNSVQGFDELGTSHIKIEFQENNLHLERTSPSNVTFIDNLPLTKINGNYNLYVGSISGHNGRVHMDYDNFNLCKQEIEIDLESPTKNKPFSSSTTEVELNWSVDYFRNNLNCSVFLNGVNKETSINEKANLYSTILTNLSVGKYNWSINCQDNINGVFNSSESSSFTILPEMLVSNDTEFMNLTEVLDLSNVTNFYVKTKFANISWINSLDLSEAINWFDYINISDNYVHINSSIVNALNKGARITLKNLTWTNPRILKNGVACGASDGCTQISYNLTSGEFIFEVTGFSTYETDETPTQPLNAPSSSSGGSSTTYYKCSEWGEWSECIEGTQTRTCARKESVSYSQRSALGETRTCIVSIPQIQEEIVEEIEQETEIQIEDEKGFFSGITGAVIGSEARKNFFVVISFLLVIGIAFFIVKGVKKK